MRVLRTGPLALIEDQGRPAAGSSGAGVSGAFDRAAHSLANRLVGNPGDAPALELLASGAAIAFTDRTWFAITGAPGEATLDGLTIEPGMPYLAAAGSTLEFGTLYRGLRRYLAVRGGIAVPAVLGSASTDTLTGLGPAPLEDGQELDLGTPGIDRVPPVAATLVTGVRDEVTLHIVRGPRDDWFTPAAFDTLVGTRWTVTPQSSRVGIRLDGGTLDRTDARELPSEGMVFGAIQVPPNGYPVILGPDHPATGGYPVIACVVDADLDLLAQAAPGTAIRFRSRAR